MEDNETQRIDSEYFRKEFLENNKKISSQYKILSFINNKKILNIKSIFLNKDFNYLSISDINLSNGFQFETEKMDYKNIIDRATYILNNNDIVVSTIRPNRNAIGFIKNQKRIIGTSGFTVLRTNLLKPEFLYIFCKTNYFITCLDRKTTATMYPAVTNNDILNTKIIYPSNTFQLQIENIVKSSYQKLEESKNLYKEAEELLLKELDLLDFKPTQENIAIKSFKDSFASTGRLDSEYYQPKYDDIVEKIKNYKGGFEKLGTCGKFVNGSFISEEYYCSFSYKPYIRIKELSLKEPINKEIMIYIDDTFQYKNETVVYENNFVIATIGNTIGKVNLITKDLDGSYISNNTSKYSLYDKNSNFHFFEILLRSFFVQEQIQKEFTQTAQPKISNYSLEEIVIPIIDNSIQIKIEEKIKKSFELKEQSKKLLDLAKKAVEVAIEQNEDKAIKIISEVSI